MPPKKSATLPLTVAEQLLLHIASRMDTAIHYKDTHPDGNYSQWVELLSRELVRCPNYHKFNVLWLFLRQKNMADVYEQYPQATAKHHAHSALGVVTKEWRRVGLQGRAPDLRRLTGDAIDKGCNSSREMYKDWPAVLHSTALESHAMSQPEQMHWWIPKGTLGKESEGMYITYILSCPSPNNGCRSSPVDTSHEGQASSSARRQCERRHCCEGRSTHCRWRC